MKVGSLRDELPILVPSINPNSLMLGWNKLLTLKLIALDHLELCHGSTWVSLKLIRSQHQTYDNTIHCEHCILPIVNTVCLSTKALWWRIVRFIALLNTQLSNKWFAIVFLKSWKSSRLAQNPSIYIKIIIKTN